MALHVIHADTGVRAYNEGDDVPASAVENLGLVPGVDVRAAVNIVPRPDADAKRYQWATYLLGKQVPVDELDEMTREQMVAKADEIEARERDASERQTAEPPAVTEEADPQPDNAPEQVAGQLASDHREPPAPNAPKREWVDYAMWRGMDPQTAKDSTAAQLAEADYDTLFGATE